MQVSDVRVKLINASAERLKAVCTVTFDGEFVVRDVKVVDGTNGLFVAMPSRKLSVHCPTCKHKNHLRARFCNDCGGKLPPPRMQADDNGRSRLHRDIAHPITPAFRELVQQRVLEAFNAEIEKAGQPGYEPQSTEPEQEEREFIAEPPAEFSEYDAMIASLRGSVPDEPLDRPDIRRADQRDRGPAVERGNSRQEPSRDRQPNRRNNVERGDRPAPPRRNSGRSEGERGTQSGRGGGSNRSTAGPRPEQPIRREQPPPPPKPVVPEQPRREPVVSKPAVAVPTRPVRPEPKPQPVVKTEVEDTGFGDGIL